MTSFDRSLLVFAREPAPGRVKTRLIPELGESRATQVYQRLLEHALETAVATPECRVELWCDLPDQSGEGCFALARQYHVTICEQSGSDLGARMNAAFGSALRHSAQVVLIGSDCPEYSAEYLVQAYAALQHHDVVLGPAADGGYVMIGMSRLMPELFTDIAWGTDTVLDETHERIKQAGVSWYEMPILHDIDTADDVMAFSDFFDGVMND